MVVELKCPFRMSSHFQRSEVALAVLFMQNARFSRNAAGQMITSVDRRRENHFQNSAQNASKGRAEKPAREFKDFKIKMSQNFHNPRLAQGRRSFEM